MRTSRSPVAGLSALVSCGVAVLPATANAGGAATSESNAEQTFGDDQIRAEVGKPFPISKSTGNHWLLPKSRKHRDDNPYQPFMPPRRTLSNENVFGLV